MRKIIIGILLAMMLIATAIGASASNQIQYVQGRMTDNTGAYATDGSLEVLIYDSASSGNIIFNQTYENIFSDGYYSIAMGNDTALNVLANTNYYFDAYWISAGGVTKYDQDWNGDERRLIQFQFGNNTVLTNSNNTFTEQNYFLDNVGIGTSSPETTLHVVGSGIFDTTFGSTLLTLRTSDWVSSTTGSALIIGLGNTLGDTYSSLQSVDVGGNSNNNLILQKSGGDVGIGTFSPLSLLNLGGTPGTLDSGLTFGDGDTGFYESVDDTLKISIAGVAKWEIAGNVLRSVGTTGGAMANEVTSSTNPTLIPNREDMDTGFGSASVDQLSLIAGGKEMLRLSEGSTNAVILPNNDTTLSAQNADGDGLVNILSVDDNNELHLYGTVNLAGNFQGADDTWQTIWDMPVTSSLYSGDDVGGVFKIDGTTVLDIKAEADGIGGIENAEVIVSGDLTADYLYGDGSNLTGIIESQNIFQTFSTTSGTSPVADTTTDTLTLTAGTGISITGDSTTDTITIANTISGGDLWSDAVDSDIIPDGDNTRSLGSSSKIIKNGYINNAVLKKIYSQSSFDDFIDISSAGTIKISTNNVERIDITDAGVQLGNANAKVTTIYDTDAMTEDSATALATQQSIKAYVDNNAGVATQFVTPNGGIFKDYNSTCVIILSPAGTGNVTICD